MKLRVFLTLLLAVCLVLAAGAQQLRQPPPYRILVSNDDGVRAPGIAAIAQILQAFVDGRMKTGPLRQRHRLDRHNVPGLHEFHHVSEARRRDDPPEVGGIAGAAG